MIRSEIRKTTIATPNTIRRKICTGLKLNPRTVSAFIVALLRSAMRPRRRIPRRPHLEARSPRVTLLWAKTARRHQSIACFLATAIFVSMRTQERERREFVAKVGQEVPLPHPFPFNRPAPFPARLERGFSRPRILTTLMVLIVRCAWAIAKHEKDIFPRILAWDRVFAGVCYVGANLDTDLYGSCASRIGNRRRSAGHDTPD
jgi:hypothetical protein